MISLVAGARPNFIKLAPILRELTRQSIPFRWVHTGQHTGALDVWAELEMPPPDVSMMCKGSHAEMTAQVLVGVEAELLEFRPNWLVVLGDVNSTLGAALAAVKLGIKIAHVEAGYRSLDWSMPEEVNRVLVDHMSDLLLCPTGAAQVWCLNEGLRQGPRVQVVGNVMMDSLRWAMARCPNGKHPEKPYAVLTVHRPSNVDTVEGRARVSKELLYFKERTSHKQIVVWPAHPRTKGWIPPHVQRVDPLGYLDMVALLQGASTVITDSGGVFEEALYLGKEIVSLRDQLKNERAHLKEVPEIWKTDAAPRIVDALLNY